MKPFFKEYITDDIGLTNKQFKVCQKASKGIFSKDIKKFLDTLPSKHGNGEDNQDKITEFLVDKYGNLMAEVFMACVYFSISPDETELLRNLVKIKQNIDSFN